MNSTEFRAIGYCVERDAVAEEWLEKLAADFQRLTSDGLSVRGVLTKSSLAQELAELLSTFAADLLGASARPTKATYFDKSPSANWTVPWHQDLTITVNAPLDIAGFSHWRKKDGLWHAQPPLSILENTVALRVHIDSCPIENGPLRVIPGSHRQGVLDPSSVDELSKAVDPVDLVVGRGDVIAMAPLLAHSSLRARKPHHRRVLHFEFSSAVLPGGLGWCG